MGNPKKLELSGAIVGRCTLRVIMTDIHLSKRENFQTGGGLLEGKKGGSFEAEDNGGYAKED